MPLRNRRTARAAAIAEPLESRQMLHAAGDDWAFVTSKGTLVLVGTPNDDNFIVSLSGGDLQVNHDGVTEDFVPSEVERIYFDGGAGNEFVQISVALRTTLLGGDGNDTLLGGSRQDSIVGGVGADFLSGGSQNDTIDGGGGNDRLFGKGGNDVLLGGSGNDRINGGIGDDVLNGGRDNDTLDGAAGTDQFFGGTGTDTAIDTDDSVDSFDGIEVR